MSSRNALAVAEFNYYLDKATSLGQIENNYFAIDRLCSLIEESIVKPYDAIQAIHGKVVEENPEAVIYALKVLNAVFYKCGPIVHKVICTDFYMSLLKEIIVTTEYENVKKTILSMLQEWAENFKCFEQYSALLKLLEELKNKEVLKTTNECKNEKTSKIHQPLCKQTNGVSKTKEPFAKNTENFDKNRLNKTDLNSMNSSSTEASNNQSDAEFVKRKDDFKIKILGSYNLSSDKEDDNKNKIKDEDFEKALQEYRQKQKMEYNKHREISGLPPLSSDEEDDIKKETKNCQASNWIKKEENSVQLKAPTLRLTRELQEVKEQRERLNNNIQQFRAFKHDDYMQSNNGASKEMQQCTDENCTNCKKFKRKVDTEDYVIPKRLPYDIRKIVDSKHRMNKGIEEIKRMKKEAYYNKNKPLPSVKNSPKKMELDDSALKDTESEDEDLKKAILLSKREMMSTSRLDAGTGEVDENILLQEVINTSFIEEEEKNFSPMPKTDEDYMIEYAKQLSLNEVTDSQSNNEEDISDEKDLDMCYICYDDKILKRFMPCSHKCICNECAVKYMKKSQVCLICQKEYTAIRFDS